MSEGNKYSEFLIEKGAPLHALGLDDIALDRAAALQAVEMLRVSSTAILGGDVFFQKDGEVEIAYANWHTDRNVAEPQGDYVNRSCGESAKYIRAFPDRPGVTPLFLLVLPNAEDPRR